MWPHNVPKKYIVTFLIITLAISWGMAAVLSQLSEQARVLASFLIVVPTMTAIILNVLYHQGVKQVYTPVFTGTTRKSILFALIYPVGFITLIGCIALITGKATINYQNLPSLIDLLMALIVIFFSMVIAFGEEYGWRGFLLPALASYYGRGWAAIGVGMAWAFYEIPAIYLLSAFGESTQPLFTSFIQGLVLLVLSIPLAYCYFLSESSIIGVLLMRAVWDVTSSLVLGDGSAEARTFLAGSYQLWGVVPLELLLGLGAAIYFGIKLQHKFKA